MMPLQNVRIAVTRAAGQAEELAALLRALGAEVVIAPLIRIVPMGESASLRKAMNELDRFDWIIFSSANGVDVFVDALRATGHPLQALRAAIACVGPATAAAAQRHGLETSVIPEEFIGEAIADALTAQRDVAGANVLIARAAGARQELPKRLREAGANVSDIELYHSAPDEEGARILRECISRGAVDVVTFTSGSTVRYFCREVGAAGAAIIAVIGPVTAAAARAHGLNVRIEADPHTTEGLVAAISKYFGG